MDRNRPPVGPTTAGDRLPCGMPSEGLLEQVADGTPPRDPAHQRHCPHCRAAMAQFTELWAPVQDLAAEDVRAPRGLLQAVMGQVRELARGGWSAVLLGDQGSTRIGARVVGAVARIAAESVPSVTLALGGGRVVTAAGTATDQAAAVVADDATSIGAAGHHVAVDVQIAVDYGADMLAVAEQVRDRITRHLAAQTGLTTTEVDVTVVDVRPPRPESRNEGA